MPTDPGARRSAKPEPASTVDANRASMSTSGYTVGQQLDVTVERVAHGGHFVARHDGLVVFVRHALPGEHVTVRVTEVSSHYLRADAITIHSPHPLRVVPACPSFEPGGCGGCDFLHADIALQRDLKLQVLREALARQGKLAEDHIAVLTADGMTDLGVHEGWRTRMRYRTIRNTGDVRLGLRAHRSDQLVDASSCVIADPIGHARAADLVTSADEDVDAFMAVGEDGPVVDVLAARGRERPRSHVRHSLAVNGSSMEFRTRVDGFWQVHPRLAQALVDTVLQWAEPKPGDRWWDLYAGVGPIAWALGMRVESAGHVWAVEGSAYAAREARRIFDNAFPDPRVSVIHADVRRWIATAARDHADPDGVVLDPPRTGAGRAVLEAVAARRPRRLILVACDPVALGRDTAILAASGYRLDKLRSWDGFSHTHHLETAALFEPGDQIS